MSDTKTLEEEFEEEIGWRRVNIRDDADGRGYYVRYSIWLKERLTALRAENAEQAKRIEELNQIVKNDLDISEMYYKKMTEAEAQLAAEREKMTKLEGCQSAATEALQKLAITLGEECDALAAEREKNKDIDCNKCIHQGKYLYCENCCHAERKDNYKDKTT